MDHSDNTLQEKSSQDAQNDSDTASSDTLSIGSTGSTEARDTLDTAVDSVPDGDEGQVKSRDPEYYGDR